MKVTTSEILVFLAAFARAAAFLQTFPLTGDRVVPLKLRAALAAMLAFAIAPLRPPLDPSAAAIAIPAELLLGFAAGFAGKLVFAGVEAGGQILGVQLGYGFAGSFDPSVAENELPPERLMRAIAGLAFLGAGGLEAVLLSLAAPPVSATTLLAAFPQLMERGAEVLVVGARLAAPALAVSLIANLAAALASRAAPALNAFSVALALSLVVGASMLLATAPATVVQIMDAARRTMETVGHVLGP